MILVVGATGTLGGRITRGLLEHGKEVRIMVRDPSPSTELAKMGMATSADSLVAAGAQLVTGDLTHPASLSAACEGVDTLITTASSGKRADSVEVVDLQGMLDLIAAAEEAGVTHFIYTSAYGSKVDHPMPMLDAKARCEQALIESNLAWTILRPVLLYEVLVRMVIGIPLQAGKPVTLVGDGNHRHAYISEADVAAFALAAVDNPAAHNVCLEIGGPSYSWRQIVAAAGQALGRELPVRFVPPGAELPLLDQGVAAWLSTLETYEDFVDMGELPARFGVEITPLATVMEQMFARVEAVT